MHEDIASIEAAAVPRIAAASTVDEVRALDAELLGKRCAAVAAEGAPRRPRAR